MTYQFVITAHKLVDYNVYDYHEGNTVTPRTCAMFVKKMKANQKHIVNFELELVHKLCYNHRDILALSIKHLD